VTRLSYPFFISITKRSLHDVHEMNAYKADSVCPHGSTGEPLDGFG
jgi:hypothetical protein